MKYKRIVLKLSGEALAGKGKSGIDGETLKTFSEQIKDLVEMGVTSWRGHRWRQYSPWSRWSNQWDEPHDLRSYGNACNHYQFIGPARLS